MKVILSYDNYFNQGKQYQAKFIYENNQEKETIANLMEQLKSTECFNFYYLDNQGNISFKENHTIGGTNIPQDILHPFIHMLLLIKNVTVIANKNNLTDYEITTIEDSINQLHINGTINKGSYFNQKSTYYIVFKYANDSQKDEILYAFHTALKQLAGTNDKRILEDKEPIMPYFIDRTGSYTSKNAVIIGGINLPQDILYSFIKYFIEEHNMIINIENIMFKGTLTIPELTEALKHLEHSKIKTRKKETT